MTERQDRKILLTGGNGQLGVHTRARLKHVHKLDVVVADRSMMGDASALAGTMGGVDGVIHLAGVNRGSDEEVVTGNTNLAKAIVEASKASGKAPPLAFANSVHALQDSTYGRAKKGAAEILGRHWSENNAVFADLLLPNLFGEFSKPNYNNFTGTFCQQIASGMEPTVNSDKAISLLHYGEAAEALITALDQRQSSQKTLEGCSTSVALVAQKLKTMHRDYALGVFPGLEGDFDLKLFNALRQTMFGLSMPGKLQRHQDMRGSFFECVRANPEGQTSFSTTAPGITRGNHFHFEKIERFVVVSGTARISVRSLADDKTWHFDVTGNEPVYVDMPPLHTHNITNTGTTELLTLFWVKGFFDPVNPDTYLEPV